MNQTHARRSATRFTSLRWILRSTTRIASVEPSAARSTTRVAEGAGFGLIVLAFLVAASLAGRVAQAAPLAIDVFTADPAAFGVTSTIVYGPTEAVVIDAQFRRSDARRLADRVAAVAPGRRLKAIILTHPHPDHVFGLSTLLERFPDTPAYMSAAGIEELRKTVAGKLAYWSGALGAEAPQAVPMPQAPPSALTVDGEPLELVEDVQGDVLARTNSYVWIPSLRAVVAGDLVYAGTHVWLADSSPASRQAWVATLRTLASRHPAVVVAGHKAEATTPDSPEAIAFVERYIASFDAARGTAHDAAALEAAIEARYPGLALEPILGFAAKAAFSPAH